MSPFPSERLETQHEAHTHLHANGSVGSQVLLIRLLPSAIVLKLRHMQPLLGHADVSPIWGRTV